MDAFIETPHDALTSTTREGLSKAVTTLLHYVAFAARFGGEFEVADAAAFVRSAYRTWWGGEYLQVRRTHCPDWCAGPLAESVGQHLPDIARLARWVVDQIEPSAAEYDRPWSQAYAGMAVQELDYLAAQFAAYRAATEEHGAREVA